MLSFQSDNRSVPYETELTNATCEITRNIRNIPKNQPVGSLFIPPESWMMYRPMEPSRRQPSLGESPIEAMTIPRLNSRLCGEFLAYLSSEIGQAASPFDQIEYGLRLAGEWRLGGVNVNASAFDFTTTPSSSQKKLVTFIYGDAGFVDNLWGPDITGGDHAFLVVRFVHNNQRTKRYLFNKHGEEKIHQITNGVMIPQFCAAFSKTPNLQHLILEYKKEEETCHYMAHSKYVGVCVVNDAARYHKESVYRVPKTPITTMVEITDATRPETLGGMTMLIFIT